MIESPNLFQEFLNRLPSPLRELVRPSVPLRDLTTLEIGGAAALLCPIGNADQAQRFQAFSMEHNISSTILGGGSNILAADEGYPGLVLRVATDGFTVQGETLTAGAGLDFDALISRSLQEGLTGLEFASGIPGTLGGALVGNAGCYGRQIGDFLVEALVLRENGKLERIGPDDFGFDYRRTLLQNSGDMVLEATLRLGRENLEQAVANRGEKIADRLAKHPVNVPSAGSWFKNLDANSPGGRRTAAGVLLEEIGAKQMTAGGAAVFPKHANIIINRGGATCGDVRELARKMADAVSKKFGVDLQQEVRYLGPPT
jgi:UDP-N-acetylmuramate dehydrogenase